MVPLSIFEDQTLSSFTFTAL